MPNRCIEIHDCVLDRVSISGSVGELYFSSVYIHQSEGRPGIDQGIGWFQAAALRVYDVLCPNELPEFPVDIGDGQSILGQLVLDNEIPLPLNFRGRFELRLVLIGHLNDVLLFVGSGADLTLVGEPGKIENFSPK